MGKSYGITLVEVLIYVAIFTVLIGTLLGVCYQTIASVSQMNKKIVIQQEANFILRKMDWVLGSAQSVVLGPKPSGISISRYQTPNQIIFSQNGNFIYEDNGGGAENLNSSNVAISNLTFVKSQTGNGSIIIQASFVLSDGDSADSQIFELTKYLYQ